MTMTYKEKLLDPRWQKKRLEILQRDEWACQWCGEKSKTLTVHHRIYIRGRDPWDYPGELLVTICAPCHEEHHSGETHSQTTLIDALLASGCRSQELESMALLFDAFLPTMTPQQWHVFEFHLKNLILAAAGDYERLEREHAEYVATHGFNAHG